MKAGARTGGVGKEETPECPSQQRDEQGRQVVETSTKLAREIRGRSGGEREKEEGEKIENLLCSVHEFLTEAATNFLCNNMTLFVLDLILLLVIVVVVVVLKFRTS